MESTNKLGSPLSSFDEWEDFLKQRYPEAPSDAPGRGDSLAEARTRSQRSSATTAAKPGPP